MVDDRKIRVRNSGGGPDDSDNRVWVAALAKTLVVCPR